MHRTALASSLALLLLASACSKAPPQAEPVRAVRTVTVGDVSAGGQVDYAGEVRARTESRLSFRVAGKMLSRRVDTGAAVKAGQVLARLDPQDLLLGQDAARAALLGARVNAEQAAADLQRYRDLRAQGFISAAELERRDSAHRAAQAQMAQAEAQAGVQGNQARYAALVADVAGVVTEVEAEPGAVLGAGATVLRLAHDGPRDVVFAVPEQQVDLVRALAGRPGAVRARLWGDPAGTAWPITVREIAAAADPVTRTFTVKADLGRVAARLGQTVTVSLAVPPQPGVWRLPLSAVFEQQGRSTVWLLDPTTMTVKAQSVQVAGAEGNEILVAGGLSAGQIVVSAGVHTLTPGQKVTRYGAPAPVAASTPAR
jgi:RND family efflux transporter MFP subunit